MSERPRRNLPPSLAASTGKVAKPVKSKKSDKNINISENIKEAKDKKIPNQINSLIYDDRYEEKSRVFNEHFPNINPTDLVWVYFDDSTAIPNTYTPTIGGNTLKQIYEGSGYPGDREYEVNIIPNYKFDDGIKRNTIGIKYWDETKNKYINYKVKFGGSQDSFTKLPIFYTEEVRFSGKPFINHYGTFFQIPKSEEPAMSFGRKKKTNLAKDLKYLLSL